MSSQIPTRPLRVTLDQVNQAFKQAWNAPTDEEFLRRYEGDYLPLLETFKNQQAQAPKSAAADA